MFTRFRQALRLLEAGDVSRVYRLLALSIFTAIIEVLGIGSIAPFIAVMINVELIESNTQLNLVYEFFNFSEPYAFMAFLAGSVVLIALLRNVLFMYYQWLSRVSLSLFKHRLASGLLTAYLAQPYSYHLRHNSTELQRNVVEEADRVIDGVLSPLLSSLTQIITCTAIVAFLVFVSPIIALMTLLVLGSCYAFIYSLVNRRLKNLSAQRRSFRSLRFRQAGEALSGIKPIILGGLQRQRAAAFQKTSYKNAMAEAVGQTIGVVPKYGVESAAILGLIVFSLYEIIVNERGAAVLPLLSLYLLAGYRLLPALQLLYSSLTRIKFESASFDVVSAHLSTLSAVLPTTVIEEGYRLRDKIELNDVTFTYGDSSEPAVSHMTLTIRARESVALVGKSGSGKSTLVDLILGLLTPDSGSIRIDGRPLDEVKAAWQGQIGYVPQHIFLLDATVAQNIAFGVSENEIDRDAVIRAAKIANVHDYVVDHLREGYDSVIGERGIRLSGGQRQRIGIARAMYRDPSILFLDEATSALDGATENVVMEAIQRLTSDVTIILIAHRTTTVQFCDMIFVLSDGRIVDKGNYSQLKEGSSEFRGLSALSEF